MATIDIMKKYGGGARCPYCNEYHGNVVLHSANHCRKNPAIADTLKALDDENYRKILGHMNKSAEDRFLEDIIKVCEMHNMILGHEDNQGAFTIMPLDSGHINWIKMAKRPRSKSERHNNG